MSNSTNPNPLAVGTAGSYSRADVVETALRILDEFGLADLSMRRLAGVLDVQPSALYWHVPNKQTLLALVSDQIIERAPVVDQTKFITDGVLDWKALTVAEATAIRDALMAYRDGAEVVSSTLALGLGAAGALDRIRTGIDAFCGDSGIANVAAESILFLVLAQVLHEQQRMQADSLGVVAPNNSAMPEHAAQEKSSKSSDVNLGIELLLAGLENRVHGLSPDLGIEKLG
jgi:AcrR family transcriptional regulator